MMSTRSAFLHVAFFVWIISKVHMVHDVPKLKIVPGSGWDALTNKDTQQIMQFTYDQCKLTNDGRFMIPDNTFAVPLNAQEIQVTSQIFENWSDYTAFTSAGFKVATDIWPKQFLPLYYSFSADYQELKTLQIKHEAFTCRSKLSQVVYRLQITPNATMIDAVKERFLLVIKALVRNNTEQARHYTEMIVSDYGTHVAKSVDVGAVVAKDDYLRERFLKVYGGNRNRILSASKLSLVEYTGFAWKNTQDADFSLLSEYNDATLEKKMRFFGGLNWNEGEVSEYIVAVDRSGDLLSNLFTASNFPRVSSSMLIRARQMFSDVIRGYYARNIHRGCTRPKSDNFELFANLDDGSCTSTTVSNYFFGGVYATCDQRTYSGADVCSSEIVNNALTGTISCPTHFETSVVHTRFNISGADAYIVYKNHKFVSCMVNESVGISYLFGGLYSNYVDNIHTNSKSCPSSYAAVTTRFGSFSLSICVNSTNDDSAKRYSLPFGGFASSSNEYQCPVGYKKHLAMKFNANVPDESDDNWFISLFDSDVNIYYCLLEREHKQNIEQGALLIRRPFESGPDCPMK